MTEEKKKKEEIQEEASKVEESKAEVQPQGQKGQVAEEKKEDSAKEVEESEKAEAVEEVKPKKASAEEIESEGSEVQEAVEEEKQEPVDHTVKGLIGRKLGMTQIFDKDGNVVPVTLVQAGPCTVLELKNDPLKVKLGFDFIKENRLTKPEFGFYKKIGVGPFRVMKEVSSTDNTVYSIGSEIKADVFKSGDYVDITGTSIGKGFQGGMKRHGWHGGPAGHGSNHHRRVGSIGASADPSRTVRGFPMPGRMGAEQVTTQGLRVVDVDLENNVILIKGSVPGCKNAIVSINKSFKKAWRSLDAQKTAVKHKVNPMKQSKAKAKGKG